MAPCRSLVSLGFLSPAAAAFSFASVGDWGGATLGDYHLSNEVAVAKQMGKTASDLDIQFVINTGDNFYYCGVQNVTDAQFKTDFEDVFTDKSLFVPWYGTLGNHDYAYNVQPQLTYKSPNNDRWQMPDRNYTKRVHLGGSNYATLVFIDTNPCISAYRADDPSGWDPCSGQYHDCTAGEGGKCHFHEHILAQDCQSQYDWLKTTLDAIDKDDWIIAAGHHPADEINVNDLTQLFIDRKINLYLNGHTHALIHYRIDNNPNIDWMTTGAGCMVHTHDQDLLKQVGADAGHSATELFDQRVSGFTVHTFSDDFSTLTTKVLDTSGNTLHSFVTAKSGSAPPSPTPPGPGPSPAGATCKAYGCGRYNPKNKCQCNSYCKQHSDCCEDYDKTCGGPSPGPSPAGATCKAYGCGKYNPKNKCQCNSYCKQHSDCCEDYEKTCGKDEVVV